MDCTIQLKSSQTEYVSAMNPNICQFMAICGILGLCGIGVLVLTQPKSTDKHPNMIQSRKRVKAEL